MTKKQGIFSFLFALYWMILWFSINSQMPENLLFTINLIDFSENIFQSLNFSRLILALFCTLLIILYFIFIFFLTSNKINKIYLFTILAFFSQLVGLYLNEERSFNIWNSRLPILAIGTVCLFILCDQVKVNNIIKYFFWITILILIAVSITIISPKITELKNLDFYSLFNPLDKNIIGGDNPRISGISRTLSIINLFLILYFFNLKNFYIKYFLLIVISMLTLIILLMESRGTLLSYFISLSFIILFLIKKSTIFRVKYFLILIIFPIILSFFIFNNYTNKEIFDKGGTSIQTEKVMNSRLFAQHSGGRVAIWSYIFKNYDYKKVFGYGPQGDRFFLKKNPYLEKGYGDNSSNNLIYTMLSGGLVSVFFWILIFFEILKIFIKQKKYFLFNKSNYYLNFSISCLIFFLLRSMIENSFALFSIDFLIIYLSIVYILNSSKISKK